VRCGRYIEIRGIFLQKSVGYEALGHTLNILRNACVIFRNVGTNAPYYAGSRIIHGEGLVG
jgi:hypothetical protein